MSNSLPGWGASGADTEKLLASARRTDVAGRLPAGALGFTGRVSELSSIGAALTADLGPAVPVIAISGMGGVGKTALAVELARQVADRFRDGLLFIDLRGFSRSGPISTLDAVRQLLRTLGVPAAEIPNVLDQATARYRTVMADRSILVVLDNASFSAQVTALVPGTGRNAVLITSRRLLAVPPGLRQVHLNALPEADALELLEETAGRRFAEDAVSAREIVKLCGYLPLTIRVVGARLAGRPVSAVAELAAGLRDESARLSILDGDRGHDGGVRNSIASSVADLGARSGESNSAAGLLTKIALLDGQEIDSRIAGVLAGIAPDAAERLLDRLTDVNLLDAAAPGRYRLHDLVAAYFDELAAPEDQVDVRLRTLDGYAAALWRLAQMSRRSPGLRDSWGDASWAVAAQDFVDREELLDWLDSERGNLVATLARAAGGGAAEQERAVRVAVAMNFYCIARKRWEEWRDSTRLTAVLAVDPAARGMLLADLGLALAELEDFDQASEALTAAVAVLEEVGHAEYQVATLSNLSHVLERAGRHDTGLEYGLRALDLAARLGNLEAEATAALVIGMIYGARQDSRQAEYFDAAVDAMRAAGAPRGLAMVYHQIGVSHLEGGRYEAANYALVESLRLYSNDDAARYLPDVQEDIGRVRLATGDFDGAVLRFEEALTGAVDLAQLDREASVRTELAEALVLTGRIDDARAQLTRAIEIYRRLGTQAVVGARAQLAELDARSGAAE